MSSAADVKEGIGGSSAGEPLGTLGSMRGPCVATEIPVNATGTRPGSGPEKRELFTEETFTVLVFPDGAIIRLSAAVATGQLIFLTNKQTNFEVVSQVVGKRVYRPTSCYVELKFTEEMAGFWGVEFPAATQEKPPADANTATTTNVAFDPDSEGPSAEQSVAEQVESAENTEDSGTPLTVAPTGKEVAELREEVEALRRQLQEMKKAEAAAKAVANMAAPGESTPASQNWVAPVAGKKQETLASVNDQTPIAPAAPVAPAVAATVVARNSHVAMSLPNREPARIDPEQEVIDQLLPQPALDFSKAPIPPKRGDWDDPYSIYKPTRAKLGKWVLVLLALALVGVVALGAWKLGFLARLTAAVKRTNARGTQAKKVAAAPKPEIPNGPGTPVVSAQPTGSSPITNGSLTNAPAANPNDTAITPSGAPGPPKTESANPVKGKTDVNSGGGVEAAPASGKATETGATHPQAIKHGNGSAQVKVNAPTKKKTTASEAKLETPVETSPVPDDAPLVPAKLLRSVSPEYPPEAMRNFITGDVIMKAEVDEKGIIRDMEVVSGPKALRSAAIDAIKQYEYAPATKGGRAVPSQIRVTIKFWFNP